MDNFIKKLLALCTLYLVANMVIFPLSCITAAREAIWLCLDTVIPSLFPFFVCSNLFIALGGANLLSRYLSRFMKPLFGVSGCGAIAVVMGLISGYPVGAACVAKLYTNGDCTKTEAQRLLAFCNNSGPLFILGAVGIGILQNQALGILLYVPHILSALTTGVIFRFYGRETPNNALPVAYSDNIKQTCQAVGSSVAESVTAILKVCGFIILFGVFANTIPYFSGREYLYSFLEITGGIKAILKENPVTNILFCNISFFLAFSGVSVLMQVMGIISPCGLSVKSYVLGKLVQGLLAFVFTYLLLMIFPITTETFLENATMLYFVPSAKKLFVVALFSVLWSISAILLMVFGIWLWDKAKKRS